MTTQKNGTSHHTVKPMTEGEALAVVRAYVPRGPLVRMTFDASAACAEADAVLATIEVKAPELERIEGYGHAGIERIKKIAAAARVVEALWRSEQRSGALEVQERERRALVRRAKTLHGILAGPLDAYVLAGALQQDDVDRLALKKKPRFLADDTEALVGLYLDKWDSIGGNHLDKQQLEEFAKSSSALKKATKQVKNRRIKARSPLADDRRLAFTALFEEVTALRAAVAAVRPFEGDAHELVPSLYVRRSAKRTKAVEAADGTKVEASDTAAKSGAGVAVEKTDADVT